MACSLVLSVKDTQLSKSLSWLLRHGALQEGLQISQEGYIQLHEIINHKSIKGKFNAADIERVVENNEKQRFQLRLNSQNILEIKANQGHSITVVNNTGLKPISELKYKTIVHGTYLRCWPQIKVQGLSRMKRQHIHLAKGTLDDKTIISGMRHNVQVYIFISLAQALVDGLKFYESENGVILTPGNKNGYLRPKYFSKVVDVCTAHIHPLLNIGLPQSTPQLASRNNVVGPSSGGPYFEWRDLYLVLELHHSSFDIKYEIEPNIGEQYL